MSCPAAQQLELRCASLKISDSGGATEAHLHRQFLGIPTQATNFRDLVVDPLVPGLQKH